MRILLVEDDATLAESTTRALRSQGWVVDCTARGEPVPLSLREDRYDLLILDIGLAGIDGFETLRRVRSQGSPIPVLILTARDGVEDRVRGLEIGADDYLVKPFALAELRARLRALLRRTGATEELLNYADVVMDLSAARALRGGRDLSLTRTEYQLLELFLRNPGRVLSHAVIYTAVWGYDFGPRSANLWVHISYLRGKLEAAGEPRVLQTVRGLGYVLRDEP